MKIVREQFYFTYRCQIIKSNCLQVGYDIQKQQKPERQEKEKSSTSYHNLDMEQIQYYVLQVGYVEMQIFFCFRLPRFFFVFPQ